MVVPLSAAVVPQPGTFLRHHPPTLKIHSQITQVAELQLMNHRIRVPQAHHTILQRLATVPTMLPLLERILRLLLHRPPSRRTATVSQEVPPLLQEVHQRLNLAEMRPRLMEGSLRHLGGELVGREMMVLDMRKQLQARELSWRAILEYVAEGNLTGKDGLVMLVAFLGRRLCMRWC